MDLTVVRPAGPTPLELLVEDYLMACKAKGLSRTTTENSYGYPLRGILLPWCGERGVDDVGQLDRRTSDAFSVFLLEKPTRQGKPLSPDSVHAYTRAVRGFLNWCEREGEEVAARPSLPKLPRHIRDVLDREEIGRLYRADVCSHSPRSTGRARRGMASALPSAGSVLPAGGRTNWTY